MSRDMFRGLFGVRCLSHGLLLFGLVSCAHTNTQTTVQRDGTRPSQAPVNVTELTESESHEVESLAAVTPKTSVDLNDSETDMGMLPETMNKKVEMWMEYFQGRGRETMSRHLARSGRYIPKMKEILKSEGLPEDLVYIALIESGFNSKAYSSASAVGFWQFIRGTARRYGLRNNYHVDDRRDFIHSTKAAAKYLKALYNLFGSWYLAMASYNVGENRVKNLVMKHYTRDFWELARDKRLPRETENYVPKFLAARQIAKHPEKYGFGDVVLEAPLDFKEVTFRKGIDIKTFAKYSKIPYKELKQLNPSYLRGVIPYQKGGAVIRIPAVTDDAVAMAALEKSKNAARIRLASETTYYRIRRGDTLSHIARRYRTSIRALRDMNGFSRRSVLYPGKRIKIPARGAIASASKGSSRGKVKKGKSTYTVRAGDNLYDIARKNGTTVAKLKSWNGLGRRSLIRKGQVLVISQNAKMAKNSRYHVVKRGDTLIAIAQKYQLKMSQLMKLNNLGRSQTLRIGKKLRIQ